MGPTSASVISNESDKTCVALTDKNIRKFYDVAFRTGYGRLVTSMGEVRSGRSSNDGSVKESRSLEPSDDDEDDEERTLLKKSKKVHHSLQDYHCSSDSLDSFTKLAVSMTPRSLTEEEKNAIVSTNIFPQLVQSEHYQMWLKGGIFSEEYDDNQSSVETKNNSDVDLSKGVTIPVESKMNIKNINSFLDMSSKTAEEKEETKIFIQNLVKEVDNLPYCISISTAKREQPGFPLIYVNKSFERMTGYSRQEIVGQNCRFLQSAETEPDQIRIMTTALKTAKSTKVLLSNRKKDGSLFKNCLAMEPVFDFKDDYAFVLGIQYPISDGPVVSYDFDMEVVGELLQSVKHIIRHTTGDELGFGAGEQKRKVSEEMIKEVEKHAEQISNERSGLLNTDTTDLFEI